MLFDHHIHSKYSSFDSTSEIKEIIDIAGKSGLGGIAISDHNAIEGSLKAVSKSSGKLLIIPSTEVSSHEGHIVALGVREIVKSGLSAKETISEIHHLGGIAIAAHPYDTFRSGVKDLCWKLDFDAIEINGHCLHGNGKAVDMAQKHGRPLVGGSDAHALYDIGSICTEIQVDKITEKDILNGIREGKCTPVYRRGPVSQKATIMMDKIARRYDLLVKKL